MTRKVSLVLLVLLLLATMVLVAACETAGAPLPTSKPTTGAVPQSVPTPNVTAAPAIETDSPDYPAPDVASPTGYP